MPSEIVHVFQPVYILSKILGTAPMGFKNGKYCYTMFGVLQSIVYFATFTALTVYFFDKYFTTVHSEFSTMKTVSFVVVFRLMANIVTMVVLFVSTCINTKHFVKELVNLVHLESELAKLDQNGLIPKLNKENRNFAIALCVVIQLVVNVIGGLLTIYMQSRFISKSLTDQIVTYVIVVYPRLIVSNINITFYICLKTLQTRFLVINNVLKKKIDDSKKMKRYPTEASFCEEITQLVSLHKGLVKIGQSLNSLFALHLLIWITVTFVLLVGDSYIATFNFFFHVATISRGVVVNLFKNLLTYSLDLFIFSHQSEMLCQEANSTKRLIVKIQIDVYKEDERNTVIAESLKLVQNRLEITACKLFAIDNALLFSICGAAFSYVFIMIQLDMGNMANTRNSTNITSL